MPLARHYTNVKAAVWLDEDHFVGTVDWKPIQAAWNGTHYEPVRRADLDTTEACYGWSKGAGFFIYSIGNGHIEKLGSVKREEIK